MDPSGSGDQMGPGSPGGAYSAPPDPIAELGRATGVREGGLGMEGLKGRRREKGEGEVGEREEWEWTRPSLGGN